MIALYDFLLVTLAVLLSPVWLVLALLGAFGPLATVVERLRPLPRMSEATVWVHAASVGEVEAAAPLVAKLVERGVPVVATTLTVTGRARARAVLPRVRTRLAPLDLPGLVHGSLARARVAVVVLIETELWPNLIAASASRGARVIVAGGRISDRSFPRYRLFAPFFAPLLAKLHALGARAELDRMRFVALGAPDERASIVGDLKLDRSPPPEPSDALRAAIGPGPLLVGGSTHPGEEEALLSAWQRLRATRAPELRLVLVPRHPERVPEVARTARRHGARVGLRSAGAADAEVAIVDTVGELASLYHLAELVFVGGSLAPVGGHNLVEPVQAGRVVVHGPHVQNQRTQVALLEPFGVLHTVENAAALERAMRELWADPERNAPAREAAKSLEEHRGATDRVLALVLAARG
ncbi:MAG TPA: 3-deoxy-D-manno-octulosonic acid transferase [Myxococcota bacterium]|nr:3-deoxy-D-manno-octulosonic acid transferase [Myxococcota bacterium]